MDHQLRLRPLARRALDDDPLGRPASNGHQPPLRHQAPRPDRLAGRLDQGSRRAVVAGEVDDAGAGMILAEAQEEADVRPAEAVDRLVGIADHAEVRARGRQDLDQGVLESVNILILVDRDPAEALPVPLREVRPRPQQRQGFQEKVVEIEQISFPQGRLIGGDPAGKLRRGILLSPPAADLPHLLQKPLRPRGSESEEIADDLRPLHRGGHPETGGEAGRFRLLPEDCQPQAVEGRDERLFRVSGQQRGQPLLQLRRGPAAEGDGEAPLGSDPKLGDQIGETVGQSARLSRPRTGDDEERAVDDLRGGPLLGVEAGPHSPYPLSPVPTPLPHRERGD